MEKKSAFQLKNNQQYENPWHNSPDNARLSCCSELHIILIHVILLKLQPRIFPQCMGQIEMPRRCSLSSSLLLVVMYELLHADGGSARTLLNELVCALITPAPRGLYLSQNSEG